MDNLERIFDIVNKKYGGRDDLKDLESVRVQQDMKKALWDIYECFSQTLVVPVGSYSYKYEIIILLKQLTFFTMRVGVLPPQVLYEYERDNDMLTSLYCQNLCDNDSEEILHRLLLDFVRDLGSVYHVFRRSEGITEENKRNFLFYLRCTWNNLFAIMGLFFITPDEILDWVEEVDFRSGGENGFTPS